MTEPELPTGLAPKGSSPTLTADNIPDKLCARHALAAGKWGILQLLEGRVYFVDLASGEEQHLTAPAQRTIAPELPHKLRLDGPLTVRIDFFTAVD